MRALIVDDEPLVHRGVVLKLAKFNDVEIFIRYLIAGRDRRTGCTPRHRYRRVGEVRVRMIEGRRVALGISHRRETIREIYFDETDANLPVTLHAGS